MHSMDDMAALVNGDGPAIACLSDAELKAEGRRLGMELRVAGFRKDLVAHAFAIIRETASRTIGMRHFDTQLMGGWGLLKGMIVEMETGEGKTLTATLAAGTAALAGVPVHIICVNDYLTARDAEGMGPIYSSLGLSVGSVVHERTLEQRRAAYRCDITYCNNKEIAFDYLRDKLVLEEMTDPLRIEAERLYSTEPREERLMLRGLHFAIADEADSLLIDEARTPLIISGVERGMEEEAFMRQAMAVAIELKEGEDFTLDRASHKIDLTGKGLRLTRESTSGLGPLWAGTLRRNEIIRKALSALHLFSLDIHYLVRDGKVQIIDEYTGRAMPDRSWERGIHQLIELKEGCETSKQRETLARITYQRFFRRYLHLSGMTGTAWEVKGELWSVYGLSVIRIPTFKPCMRERYPDVIVPTLGEKGKSVLEAVRKLTLQNRPVLVGTRSVSVSEELSALFAEEGLAHKVLNAKNDREEADIIKHAGEPGTITIATNMAGRGTDIKLGAGVAELKGLHVILTELHEAGRIDRQLVGRCARQGDPGSYGVIVSAEDPLLIKGQSGVICWCARHMPEGSGLWKSVVKGALFLAQKKMERLHGRIRHQLLKQDEKIGSMLSFSGTQE